MEETPNTSTLPRPGPWTRVIVLAPPHASTASAGGDGASLPANLRQAFEARDWFSVVHHDPYSAMTELALRERALAARAAWGLQRMEGLAVVVVDPASWPASVISDFIGATRRWLPEAALWTAMDDRIEPVAPSNFDPVGLVNVTRPAMKPDLASLVAALPRGQAAATAVSDQNGTTNREQPPISKAVTPSRLSRDEIDMLLEDDGGRVDTQESRP